MSRFLSVSKRALLYLAIALAISFATSGRLWAQAQAATITGTATDSSGAALVGAAIKATNLETNVSQSTTTDSQGRFTIPQLSVGTYSVEASLSGFQTLVHSGVILSVGGTAVVDFSLPVGNVSQTISVEGNVSRVQTTTSELSTLVSPQQMRNLPLNGRNFEQLIALAPGVVTLPHTENLVTGALYGRQDNYSVSGSRPTGQMFLLDGTDIRDFWEHGTGSGYAGTSLGVDAIGQFQVLTNTYDAQFAGNGVVMNATSRSGTNKLHGGAYEYIRNSALDARGINDPLSGPPPFRRNQFGVDIGGPIKRDKAFFFGNWEGLRESLASTVTPINLPMPYVAQGQLPCSELPLGYSDGTNTCPGTAPVPGTWSTPGSGNNPLINVAPADGSPEAAAALARMKAITALYGLCKDCAALSGADNINNPVAYNANHIPTAYSLGGYFTTSAFPALVTNEDYTLDRVDYNIGANDSMFARYVFDDARQIDGPRDPLGIFQESNYTRNQFLTITERHIVSPTMVNSIRFGYVRNNENSKVPLGLTSAQLQKAGLTSDPLDFVRAAYGEPQREDGQTGAQAGTILASVAFPRVGPDADRPDQLVQTKFSGGDDLAWTHGAHSLKIGIVVTRVQTNNDQMAYANGQTFNSFTSLADLCQVTVFFCPANTTTPMERYIMGTPTFSYSVPPGFANSTRYFREIMVAPYIEDDWKISPKLTLNLGIRYDYDTNPVCTAGAAGPCTSLVGSYLPPIGPVSPGPLNCTGLTNYQCNALQFTPVRHVFQTNPNAANWGPRIGFAYSPFADNKTAIRAGFGIFHDPVAARIYESGFVATSPAASYLLNTISSFTAKPGPCMPDPFVVAPSGYCGFTTVPPPGEFAGVSYIVPNGSPYEMQYNLNVQRQIMSGTVLTVGYVGSVARHLWIQRDINPPKCTTYPNCTALPTVSAPNTGVQFINSTTPGARINPAFGAMITEATTAASSYNSLQVGLSRQFAHNLAGQVNYTWSHCIDNGSFATSLEEFAQLDLNSYNQRYDYGNCIFDVRHNISINALYSLPFKGNRLVEGWQISTITAINSGAPVNISNGQNDPAGLGTQWASRPNYTFAAGCNPNHLVKGRANINGVNVYQWFDPACYTPQAPGYLGNVGRNGLPGPGLFDMDFSILKTTKIKENMNLQFRAEFFNLLNHYNPGAPVSALGTAGNVPTGYTSGTQGTPRQIQFALKLDF